MLPGTHEAAFTDRTVVFRKDTPLVVVQTGVEDVRFGRERTQQALFQDMQHTLESPSTFLRLPFVSWAAPPALISDMSGPTLLQLFGALIIGGSTPTRQILPTGNEYLPDGEEGLGVSTAEKDSAVRQFMRG